MINKDTRVLLKQFFSSTDDLIEKGIIRSSKYTADIAEYLCQEIYELTLCKSQREPGFDGKDKNNKVYQIKINNSKKKTNQEIGNPNQYDFFLLMITSNSKLFDNRLKDTFIAIYKLNSEILLERKYIAKKVIFALKPEYLINDNFEIKTVPNSV